MVTRRAVIWTLIVLPLAMFYWSSLVDSLEGNRVIAILLITMAWFCGCVDINDMVGQPEQHDHHHD
jgi:hypothetical protein